jgi:hypothetical protein
MLNNIKTQQITTKETKVGGKKETPEICKEEMGTKK